MTRGVAPKGGSEGFTLLRLAPPPLGGGWGVGSPLGDRLYSGDPLEPRADGGPELACAGAVGVVGAFDQRIADPRFSQAGSGSAS